MKCVLLKNLFTKIFLKVAFDFTLFGDIGTIFFYNTYCYIHS